MSHATVPMPHPVLRCTAAIERALDAVADASTALMTVGEKRAALLAVTRQQARLEALRLRVLADSTDVAADSGARSADGWLAQAAHLDTAEARRVGRLASSLDRYPLMAAALAAGDLGVAQAEVIARCLAELPADLDRAIRDRAERELVARAAEFDPRRLRILGRRILEIVAPGVADEHEQRLLVRDERRAWDQALITTYRLGNGLSRAVMVLPDPVLDLWLTQLHAYTSPRRGHLDSQPAGVPRLDPESAERLPYPQLLARAFCAMVERSTTDALPQHGGSPASLMVTIDLAALESGVGSARPPPAPGSAPARYADSPATRGSCRRCSAGSPSCSTSGVAGDSSARRSVGGWRSGTTAAARRAATSRPRGRRPTTCGRGAAAVGPTWPTACCCARSTITGLTTPATT